MTDYISREAAIETIKRLYPGVPLVKLNIDKWHEKNKAYMECEAAIERIPAADVRPVVLCKDCVHRHIRDWPSCQGRRGDFFCADGKKREES